MTTGPENSVLKMTVPLSSSFQGQDSPHTPNPAPPPWPCSILSPEEPASNLKGLTRVLQAGLNIETSFLPLSPWAKAPVFQDQFTSVLLGPRPFVNWGLFCVCTVLSVTLRLAQRTSETEATSYGFPLFRNRRSSWGGQRKSSTNR